MQTVCYLSHPIGDGGTADDETRADHIANAGEWMRFFIDTTRWVIWCPWYVYAITHGEQIYAPRRLVDQLASIERCDLLLLTGGYISPHMSYEIDRAKRVGIPVVDLTTFGISPPSVSEDNAQLIVNRVQRTVAKLPRRVHMPLFTTTDIDNLKAARHALDVHLAGEHEGAVKIIDRILEAALEIGS